MSDEGAGSNSSLSGSQQAGLLDRKWEELQAKTFTKWINSKIRDSGHQIKSVVGDELSDGIVLATLLTSISEEKCVVNKKPTMRIHKIENVNKCLEFIKSKNVNLVNIGAIEIVDGNTKLLLGMMWTIILRFTIADISSEGRSAREGLMLWCQRRLENYGIRVENFTNSWADGRAYLALVHSQDPDAYEYEKEVKSNERERTEKAFDVADKRYGVAKLLDAEDACMIGGPDEKSNLTYIAALFHAFSQRGNIDRATRRVNTFSKNIRHLADMRHEYESRTKTLLEQYSATQQNWASTKFADEYAPLVELRTAHRAFRQGTSPGQKRAMIREKRDLITLYSNIQTNARSFLFKPYTAPEGLRPDDVDAKWVAFLASETTYQMELKAKTRAVREGLQRVFADAAEQFEASLTEISKTLVAMPEKLQEQKVVVNGLQEKAADLRKKLPEIERHYQRCVDAKIEDNDFTNYSYSDLEFDCDLVEEALRKKVDFVTNQLALSSVSNITDEQFRLYEATFRQICKNDQDFLLKNDFKAALASLNIGIPDEEVDNTFARVSKGKEHILLVDFVEYMRSVEEDVFSKEQIKEAFDTLAGDKQGKISLAKLKGCSKDHGDALAAEMEKDGDDSYNYNAFVDNVFE